MKHIGFLPLNSKGHMYPASALALHLKQRGHRITFFCFEDSESFFREQALDVVVVGRRQFPLGYTARVFAALGRLKGLAGVRYTITLLEDVTSMQLTELPEALRANNVDALVIDQFCMGGAAVADHLRLPYVHVAYALMLNSESAVPPIHVGWRQRRGPLARLRNTLGHATANLLLRPVRRKINVQRRRWGLRPYRHFPDDAFAGHPQISQQPSAFEYPRYKLPKDFHFIGPLHSRRTRKSVDFPWDRLDGRPLIYASMGTLQTGLAWIFEDIVEACSRLPMQLVLSLGEQLDPAKFALADAVVVKFAPQLELLQRASLCITHAGMNTALECLAAGVPMVAIPITNDQPAIGARIEWTGTGVVLKLKQLSVPRLREAIETVLGSPSYAVNAKHMQQSLAYMRSLDDASRIVESILD